MATVQNPEKQADEQLQARLHDPLAVFAESVAGRLVVYLDQNIWIDLRDAVTPADSECLALCTELVASKRVVFPVSYAAVSELFQVPVAHHRHRQAELMDALSGGVTFLPPSFVYAAEAHAGYGYVMHRRRQNAVRNVLFSYVPDHIGRSRISFPNGSNGHDARTVLELLRQNKAMRSLAWQVQHMDVARVQATHAEYDAKYVEAMTKQREGDLARRRSGRRPNRKTLVHLERVALFKQHVLPVCNRDLWNEHGMNGAAAARSLGVGSAERLRDAFQRAMPSLELCANMMAHLSMDPARRSKRQDFWDFEHAAVAPVYADAFATKDGWLKDRVATARRIAPSRCAVVLASTRELLAWLRTRLV